MRVLVAGATSTLGVPVLRELAAKGHEALGLTRSQSTRARIEGAGAELIVGDVLDRERIAELVRATAPDAVLSLLITLPKRGPMRVSHFQKTKLLWRTGVPNLLTAAQAAGCCRFVAESVIFAYGYGRFGPEPLDEDAPATGPPFKGGEDVLDALRSMERAVLVSASGSDTEGIVLRYGAFHGADVPSTNFMVGLVRRRMMLVPDGDGLLSWIEIGDAATATVAALERGRGGEIYNVVDDEPVSYRDYIDDLAALLGRRPPPSVPQRLARRVVPYAATILGDVRLPVSNAKAKRELGWVPSFPDHGSAQAAFAGPAGTLATQGPR